MEENKGICPICNTKNVSSNPVKDGSTNYLVYECSVCGKFYINESIVLYIRKCSNDIDDETKFYLTDDISYPRHHLSYWFRKMFESDKKGTYLITSKEDIDKLARFYPVPATFNEKINMLLLECDKRFIQLDKSIRFIANDYSTFCLHDFQELNQLIDYVSESGLISTHEGQCSEEQDEFFITIKITPKGYERLEKLRISRAESNKVFVAMAFGKQDEIYTDAIKPAIEACGFQSIRVDKNPHNNNIYNEIIARIRESNFMVADFTGQRNGVYYEAGFAKGLGIQVVHTVKKDELDKLHFDTKQINHLVWENDKLEEFKENLINQIIATIPRARRVKEKSE